MSLEKSNLSDLSSGIPHYRESERTYQVNVDARLPKEVFSQALDHIVIACVDLVFTYQQQVLLAKRRTYPQKSWWVIGGRMIAGESPLAAAQRKAEQEAALILTDDRCQYIGTYSTCFAQRQQAPQERGLHSLNITYQVRLTAPEKAALQLDTEEYDCWQWCTYPDVLRLVNPTKALNQALLNLLSRVSPLNNEGLARS